MLTRRPPPAVPASLLLDLLQTAKLGSTREPAGNRIALEGLTWGPRADGLVECGVRQLEGTALHLAAGAIVLEVDRLALHELTAQVRFGQGAPQLSGLAAARAELAGVKLQGPLVLPRQAEAALHGAWTLTPLADAEGMLHAQIVDAHLLFDADVTVPIRQGQVEFNAAKVEHVGPDSRMGVSRMGVYVDAPNGRSYLYQFTSAPVAGIEFERRGALPGPWVSDRGRLRLQEVLEGLLRQPLAAPGHGITDQARLLFDRTALSGHVQMGDGKLAAPGVQAVLTGRSQGRNLVRLRSQAVGRGLGVEIAALAVRDALLQAGGLRLACSEATGTLKLETVIEGAQARFVFEAPSLKLAGLRLG